MDVTLTLLQTLLDVGSTTKFISSIESIDFMATTISVREETKQKLKHLGRTGDSYDDIIQKMYEATKKTILMQYLYDETDSIGIDEAIEGARKRWPKS